MKIEFENLIRRLSFLGCLTDIKIACINPCWGTGIRFEITAYMQKFLLRTFYLIFRKIFG